MWLKPNSRPGMYSPAPGSSSQLMVDPAWLYLYLHINTHYELTLSKRVIQTINNISITIQYSITTIQSNILMAQPYTQAQPVSYSLSIGAWVLERGPMHALNHLPVGDYSFTRVQPYTRLMANFIGLNRSYTTTFQYKSLFSFMHITSI